MYKGKKTKPQKITFNKFEAINSTLKASFILFFWIAIKKFKKKIQAPNGCGKIYLTLLC